MGINIYDYIVQDGQILLRYEFTQADFNKWGDKIDINFNHLYLYPKVFIDEFQKKFGVITDAVMFDYEKNLNDRELMTYMFERNIKTKLKTNTKGVNLIIMGDV